MNHIQAIQDGFTEFQGTGSYYKWDSPHCSGGGGELKRNGETLWWFKNNQQNGKCSRDKIKEESVKFFGRHIESTNKKTIFNKLTEFIKNHKNLVTLIQRMIQRENNGQGVHNDNPPDNFQPDKTLKERKMDFKVMCKSKVNNHEKYKDWEN